MYMTEVYMAISLSAVSDNIDQKKPLESFVSITQKVFCMTDTHKLRPLGPALLV